MKKLFFISLLFFASWNLLCGQDIRKETSADIIRIREAYENCAAISMNVNYRFYATHHSVSPVETHQGYYSKQGSENFRMELYGTLTLSNKDLMLVKDDSSGIFLLKKYSKSDIPRLSHDQFEKLLEVCSKVERIIAKDEKKSGYKLTFKGGIDGMEKLEFFFDRKTYLLVSTAMYFNRPVVKSYQTNEELDYTKPKIEVEYVNVNTNPVFNGNQFSLSKYLKKENTKWQLTSAYASEYKLYDQTELKLK